MQPELSLDVTGIPDMIQAFDGDLRYISKGEAHFLYVRRALETGDGKAAVTGKTAAKEKRRQTERIFQAVESVVKAIGQLQGHDTEMTASNGMDKDAKERME